MSDIKKYKDQVKSVWDERYDRHIIRTVHQAGDDAETNIKLADLEIDLFLWPEEQKCISLYENKELRKCAPTFMKEFYKHNPIEDYIGDLKERKVLDYGCGSLARYVIAFSKFFDFVVGVDSSPKAIEYAKQYTNAHKNIFIHENNGVDLSGWENEEFDFVFSNLVFQHVGSKEVIINLFKEVYRVLNAPGVARFSTWTEEKDDSHFSVYNGTGFSVDGYKKVFEDIGFKVETMTHEYPVLWVTLLKE